MWLHSGFVSHFIKVPLLLSSFTVDEETAAKLMEGIKKQNQKKGSQKPSSTKASSSTKSTSKSSTTTKNSSLSRENPTSRLRSSSLEKRTGTQASSVYRPSPTPRSTLASQRRNVPQVKCLFCGDLSSAWTERLHTKWDLNPHWWKQWYWSNDMCNFHCSHK